MCCGRLISDSSHGVMFSFRVISEYNSKLRHSSWDWWVTKAPFTNALQMISGESDQHFLVYFVSARSKQWETLHQMFTNIHDTLDGLSEGWGMGGSKPLQSHRCLVICHTRPDALLSHGSDRLFRVRLLHCEVITLFTHGYSYSSACAPVINKPTHRYAYCSRGLFVVFTWG